MRLENYFFYEFIVILDIWCDQKYEILCKFSSMHSELEMFEKFTSINTLNTLEKRGLFRIQQKQFVWTLKSIRKI